MEPGEPGKELGSTGLIQRNTIAYMVKFSEAWPFKSGLLFEVQNLRNILLVGSGLRLSVDSAVRKQKQTKK